MKNLLNIEINDISCREDLCACVVLPSESSSLERRITIQKWQIITILSFSALFSLFFSSASLADSNQSQDNIMQHLVNGAPSCHIPKNDTEGFRQYSGYCFGFSAVWLYAKWLQVAHPENGDLYKITVTDIMGAWSNCANIKTFAFLVRKLHNSQITRTFEEEFSQLDTHGKKLKKEYSIASLFTLKQLKQLLRENIIHDHKLIFITSHNHATALFKNGDKYYYFDSNCKAGESVYYSTDHVAEAIFFHNDFENAKLSPLVLEIFSFDEKSSEYPSQQEILKRTNPSIGKSDYVHEDTGLYLAARIGCLESTRYFLNKGAIVDQANARGFTALMLAAQNGYIEVVHLLLKKRADVNKANSEGWTALMIATYTGCCEVAQLLVDNGADVNKKNNNGERAIDIAKHNDNKDMVKILTSIRNEL